MSPIIILTGALLFTGLTASLPVKRASSNATVSREGLVYSGVIYAENLLLSCYMPTMLPEVPGIAKLDCSANGINPKYTSLIDALDKVLRLYDLQEKLLQNYNMSVETRALQFVIDAVLNQTCDWIESLGVSYNGSTETFSCDSSSNSIVQIKKLKALVSTYHLLTAARASTPSHILSNLHNYNWLQESGVRPSLSALLNNTDYTIHLNNPRCRFAAECRESNS